MADEPQITVDVNRTDKICLAALSACRDNFNAGPHAKARVFEALDALAFCAAVVIDGTGHFEAAVYFQECLRKHLNHE